jgi:membrane protease YdiL (CAAX protease family)
MDPGPPGTKLGLVLRVGVFVFLGVAGLIIFGWLMNLAVPFLVAATLSTFAAAAVANALVLRIYERGQLADIGLHWGSASRRNLLLGVAGGMGSACLVLVPPLLVGAARLQPDPNYPASLGSFVFVTVVLLFGAVGEEMLFRGYGFQILLDHLGPYATILPVAVVFGLAHSANQYASTLGLINTVGWGVVFGYAFLRSGDLWLPIGLHFGWNWVLPMFGVNLSGFTMKTAGYTMQWKASGLWSGGAYGPEGGVLTSFAVVAIFVYLWKAPVRQQAAFLLRRSREEA